MGLAELARHTLAIVDSGGYDGPAGRVEFGPAVRAAIDGTRTITPAAAAALAGAPPRDLGAPPCIEVTDESTAAAGRRLLASGPVTVLNFASARRIGGGFLGGAQAQEEALCRVSALYRCLETAGAYYAANRAHGDALYTDHAIWSPDVPFFRGEDLGLLSEPFSLSVLTSPAPNTNAVHGAAVEALVATFHRRAAQVIAIAAAEPPRQLVLGAWGCGAFGGDPALAADAFGAALDAGFGRAFVRVVFAVLVRSRIGERNLAAFRARFG
ncbi:MAG: TIGR02452 family protein [Planctomycetes bacterium]|nr:TIGR02452 family protein [Planctomycetota bacterium]